MLTTCLWGAHHYKQRSKLDLTGRQCARKLHAGDQNFAHSHQLAPNTATANYSQKLNKSKF